MAVTSELLLQNLRNFAASATTEDKLKLLRNAYILDENGDLAVRFFQSTNARLNQSEHRRRLTEQQLAILRKPVFPLKENLPSTGN